MPTSVRSAATASSSAEEAAQFSLKRLDLGRCRPIHQPDLGLRSWVRVPARSPNSTNDLASLPILVSKLSRKASCILLCQPPDYFVGAALETGAKLVPPIASPCQAEPAGRPGLHSVSHTITGRTCDCDRNHTCQAAGVYTLPANARELRSERPGGRRHELDVRTKAQTTLSVVLEVEPVQRRPSSRSSKAKRAEETLRPGDTERYSRLKRGVPTVHFLSMSVFQAPQYDPLFVIEANFDGPPGPFWAQMEATLADDLRRMLRCCKRPSDDDGSCTTPLQRPTRAIPSRRISSAGRCNRASSITATAGSKRERILRRGRALRGNPSQAGASQSQQSQSVPQHARAADPRELAQRAAPFVLRGSTHRLRHASLRGNASATWGACSASLIVMFALSIPGFLFLVFLRAFFPGWASWFIRRLEPGTATPAFDRAPGCRSLLYPKRSARPGEAAPTSSGGLTRR